MNKNKGIILCLIGILFLILMHNPLNFFLSNVLTLFREDNSNELISNAYKERIEYLEKELSLYETTLNNLELYKQGSYVLSKISLRNPYNFYDFLIINTDSIVTEKDTVINENGLVGIISEVSKNEAKVSLLTGIDNLSVKIGTVYGILDDYNKKDNLFIVHGIDNYKTVSIGEDVYTSGLTEIRGDILIGSVAQIEEDGIEQVVYVKSDVDFDNLNYLMVITK